MKRESRCGIQLVADVERSIQGGQGAGVAAGEGSRILVAKFRGHVECHGRSGVMAGHVVLSGCLALFQTG